MTLTEDTAQSEIRSHSYGRAHPMQPCGWDGPVQVRVMGWQDISRPDLLLVIGAPTDARREPPLPANAAGGGIAR